MNSDIQRPYIEVYDKQHDLTYIYTTVTINTLNGEMWLVATQVKYPNKDKWGIYIATEDVYDTLDDACDALKHCLDAWEPKESTNNTYTINYYV